MTYSEALAWLYGTQDRGIKLGLERTREMLAAVGWKAEGNFLHVAGTNGKGSVCAMLDSICRAGGMRTGLFTSPHLVSFRERIRIGGEMVASGEIAEELSRMRDICDRMQATFFEIATALALLIFQRRALDVVVLETGLGGRLDATNVVTPKVSVITSIGLDHTRILGGTLAEIAREKAGIIKPGVPVVTGRLPEEAVTVIAAIAADRRASLIQVCVAPPNLEVSLKGAHQRINAAVAARALEAAGIDLSTEALADGSRRVNWPGRFQDSGNGFILDGAHNPEAARRLVETWREQFEARRPQVILGIVADKDAPGICAELAEIAEDFVVVPVRSPRAGSVEGLAKIAAERRPTRICGSLEEAIATARRPALITGSLFLMGEALVLLGLAEGAQEISAQ